VATSSNESYGFHVSKMGVVSGPHSNQEISAMMDREELSGNDLIRIEIWLPFATFRLLNLATPIQNQGSVDSLQPTTASSNPTLPRKADESDSKQKYKGSISPTIAAGVGGLVAGAVATSLLMPGTAHAASSSELPHSDELNVHGVAADSDGDGLVDTVGIDTNHDGRLDTFGIDLDEDGKVDAVGIDTDDDGSIDTFGFDTDADGDMDVVAYDYDEDGQVDDYEEM